MLAGAVFPDYNLANVEKNSSRGFAMRVFLVFASIFVVGLSAMAEPVKVDSVEGVTEYKLDNGARVLFFPEQSRPTITVNMTVLVGSRHEGYGESGMAHLLEHMVFKGTPMHPEVP